MILDKIKSHEKEAGFTIVELLVVIIVIAILATITIVSYVGMTARANATKQLQNATSAQAVINAYTADSSANYGGDGIFPANVAAISGFLTNGTTKLPGGVTIKDISLTASSPSPAESTANPNVVTYLKKGTTGGCIYYYDASASAVKYVFVGDATNANVATIPFTCT